jgi:ribosomal protein S18 acetylase RimI-like enzyme
MLQATQWLDSLKARRKIISVAGGNEGVFSFYRRFNYYPTAIQMAQVRTAKASAVQLPVLMTLRIYEGGPDQIDLIQPLWEKLSRYEGDLSARLKDYFYHRSFAVKKETILKAICEGCLKLDLLRPLDSSQIVGYCLSTIDRQNAGEIQSFYIEPDFREQGTGRLLFQRALDWMAGKGVEKRTLWVVFENKRAIRFYNTFNFYPLSTTLLHFPT